MSTFDSSRNDMKNMFLQADALSPILLNEKDFDKLCLLHKVPHESQQSLKELLKNLFSQKMSSEKRWALFAQNPLVKSHKLPFALLLDLYQKNYGVRAENFLAPQCFPEQTKIHQSPLKKWMDELGTSKVEDFQKWSSQNREVFWKTAIEKLQIIFEKRASHTLSFDPEKCDTQILNGSTFNIVKSCFQADASKTAIVERREAAIANEKDGIFRRELSYAGLESLCCVISERLQSALHLNPSDPVAIVMPLNIEAVAIYLACQIRGLPVVSIADSFASDEIATRLKISQAKVVFTQELMLRQSKKIPLYSKVCEASDIPCVVVPLYLDDKISLRAQDKNWNQFLTGQDVEKGRNLTLEFSEMNFKIGQFDPVIDQENRLLNILFSSGTTSEPKAIAWTQSTPIKCAVDAQLHMDFCPSDICHWPTNLGWMMGPWLLWSTFLNRATLALFDGAPHSEEFAKFCSDEKISFLGVVPSLVKSFRSTQIFEKYPLTHIRAFASTGECSNPEDMFWLSSLSGFKPIIEYCGGTEIGGGYMSSTCIEANYPSCFSTKSFGLDFVILGENGKKESIGEIFIVPPSLGLSNTLLNRNHFDTYFKECPVTPEDPILRRHGDEIEWIASIERFRAQGRSDDTMNLGGIKVSSAEIERCVGVVEGVLDCAAIALAPKGGGPSQLYIAFVVSQKVDTNDLFKKMQQQIRDHLNPLFKIFEIFEMEKLPRTASNKVMRRVIRSKIEKEISNK